MKIALAPPVAPLACPKCGKVSKCFGIDGQSVEQVVDGGRRSNVYCAGCKARLWLYLGAIDANGVGVTHLVPV